MGLEEKAQNVHPDDLRNALHGHLPNGYKVGNRLNINNTSILYIYHTFTVHFNGKNRTTSANFLINQQNRDDSIISVILTVACFFLFIYLFYREWGVGGVCYNL